MRQTIALRSGQRKRRNGLGEDKVMLRQSAMSTAGRTGGVAAKDYLQTEAWKRPLEAAPKHRPRAQPRENQGVTLSAA